MVRVMVFNTTFNNMSVISWLSTLLVEVTGCRKEGSCESTSEIILLTLNTHLK